MSKKRISLEASHLLIDENGVTGNIAGKNILSLEAGDASGWGFSVEDFRFSLLANQIKGFGFGGQINVPISEKSQLRPYEAYISNNEYLFKVGLGENLSFDIFGQAQMRLDPTSYLLMQVKNKQFRPKLVFERFDAHRPQRIEDGADCFQKAGIRNRIAPFFSRVRGIRRGSQTK